MLKNSTDFSYAISKIVEPIDPNIIPQGKILESDKFNTSFEEMEKTLNTLYEKTRYLEDSIQYAKTFLETKNREFNNEMQAIIKELESLLNMSKNLAYISHNVPLIENTITIKDRDTAFSNLNPLILKDKVLTLGYDEYEIIEYSSIEKVSNSIPYDDNLTTIKQNNNKYKVIYLEEKLVPGGLTESFIIYFSEPSVINILDFVPVNSTVKNIKFGLINGIEESVSDYDLSLKNVYRSCIYIKFDLVCTNYNTIEYLVQKDKITENLWNDIKEFELSTMMSRNISKLNTEYIISRTITNKSTGKSTTTNFKDKTKSGKLATLKLYSYIFGLDDFKFINAIISKTGYFISDYINIGKLSNKEYISLYVSHVKDDNTCIEYSILDGEKEIPILPIDHDLIENEPIFNSVKTRFNRDTDTTSKYYVKDIIKKDGQLTDITFDDALNMNDGQYSITYKPNTSHHNVLPINKEIRIKAYIRTYGSINTKSIPYIDMITIRKFGEETLWTNSY